MGDHAASTGSASPGDELDLGATLKGFTPGQRVFGRYALRRIIGRGGMGVVWLSWDEELEREVALKFLPEIVAHDRESLADLKRETRRNLSLTHPHIVRVYDFVQSPLAAAISMEYVDGASLSAMKVDRPGGVFPLEMVTGWAEQLCAALGYAHRVARIVHRDLKPANLMINARGELKVTDFGIARSVADSVSRVSAQAGRSSGTPVYMSPQQMMGEDPAVTDDIYAAGATLYELLAGKPPFHSGNILLQVQTKEASPLNERRLATDPALPPVPVSWEQTIAACLAKEPRDRPQSAEEMLDRLCGRTVQPWSAPSLGSVSPIPAAPAPPAPVVRRPRSPARLVLGVGAAVALVLVLGWWLSTRPAPAPAGEASAQTPLAAAPVVREEPVVRPEAEPAPVARTVRFTGLPAETAVLVDGRSLVAGADGTVVATLPLGRLPLTAVAPGHEQLAVEVEITATTSDLALALKPAGPPRELVVPLGADVGISFRRVEAGEFFAGTPADEVGRQRNDLPRNRVAVGEPFYLATTEMTQLQHRVLMGRNPSGSRALGDESRPVEQVAWRDLVGRGGVIERLNEALVRLGLPYQADLPTEIEWEYACRAGTESAFNDGSPLSGELEDAALAALGCYARGGALQAPMPVARYRANAWGFFDMHGNVAEWTYGVRGVRDPVLRGGSWKVGPVHCRSASRVEATVETRPNDTMGYRLVLRRAVR